MKKLVTLGLLVGSLCSGTLQGATITGFGLVVDGVPNNDGLDLAYLNAAISAYNDNLETAPILGTETFYRIGAPGSLTPLSATTSYRISQPLGQGLTLNGNIGDVEYIVVHYGGQGGGADMMYYVGDIALGDHYLSDWNPHFDLGGISSVTFFGAGVTSDSGTTFYVPDGGTTLALFGLGLCGIYTVGRVRRK